LAFYGLNLSRPAADLHVCVTSSTPDSAGFGDAEKEEEPQQKGISRKTEEEVKAMRIACRLARQALDFGGTLVKVWPFFLH